MKPDSSGIDLLLDEETLYKSTESRSNRFNLKALAVLCVIILSADVLNTLGVFIVDAGIMHFSTAVSTGFFLLPILIWAIHDKIFRRTPSVTEWTGFKYIIVLSVYVGVALFCIVLTFHSVILLALPPVLAAQYSNQRHLVLLTMIGSILMVPLSVYGGFFFGLPDSNLLGIYAKNTIVPFEQRLELATGKRMLQLLFHYVIPRMLCVTAIDMLASGIARRNGNMLRRQSVLASKVQEEMESRNDLQAHVIEDLAALIETRDIWTGKHVARTKKYVGQIAHAMQNKGLCPELLGSRLIEEMEIVAPLHDIGKIAISDTILLKPGKLTFEEFDIMKTHTIKGGEMIRNIFSNLNDPDLLKTAEEISIFHHEKWDGSGYPFGLKGSNIPLPARIMAVADVYDALISERVYKKAMPPEDALQIIYSERGRHFDPEIVDIIKEDPGILLS